MPVTKKIEILSFNNISYIDTPGFESDKILSDNPIFSDINDNILYKASINGTASILQCVMVSESGRIHTSAIRLMSELL